LGFTLRYSGFSGITAKTATKTATSFTGFKEGTMRKIKNNIGIRTIMFKSKKNATGQHPIVIVMRSKGRRKILSTGFWLYPQQWNFEKQEIKYGVPNKLMMEHYYTNMENELRRIIEKFDYLNKRLSLEELVAQFKRPRIESKIYPYFDLVIEELKKNEKVRNASVYKTAKNVMKSFAGDENLTFHDVDHRFLEEMSYFLRKRGVKDGALSNYFRTIRALFNRAIKDDEIDQSVYPFEKFSVGQFRTESVPKTISKEEVHAIIEFYKNNPESELCQAAEIFTFIYLTGGINFKDICKLTWKSIMGDKLHYFRSKTGKAYNLIMQPLTKEIIDKYRKEDQRETDYIFPFLDPERHVSAQQINDRSKKCLRMINADLKRVGEEVGTSIPLTTYVARHSLASNLCANGVSVKVIQNLLGHSRLETTNNYLRNFNADEINDHIAHLL
jgi:site-specific recombinase XerD